MKKLFATAVSALALTVATSNVAEARDGVYLAVRGGLSDYNMNKKDESLSTSARAEFGRVWNVSGALGYKYKYFRVEAEYTYRDDDSDTLKDDEGDPMNDYTLESDSFMLNAYLDLMPNYWISPYIGGGIGISRMEFTNQDVGGQKYTWDDDIFSWQAGAGLSLRLNRCLNFDMGYRYIDMGDIDDADITAHEWYAGLRYTF